MTDIVERLRTGPVWGNGSRIGSVVGEINGAAMNEAADEIERLRGAMIEIKLAIEESAYGCSNCKVNCGPVIALNETYEIISSAALDNK